MQIIRNVYQLIIIALIFIITSCTFETLDGVAEPDPGIGLFQADFKGATWKSNRNEAIVSGNFIQISVSNSIGENFGIMIDGSKVGTYAANNNIISFSPAGTEFGYWGVNDDNPTEDTGSVVITNINTAAKTISGTFQFKGYWSDWNTPKSPITFTNGIFKDIPYTTQEESADVFTAKVGNANFVATDIFTAEINDFITIGTLDANLNNLSIAVKNTLGTGSHTITNTVGANVQGSYEDVNEEYKAVSGNITITSKTNDRIKGTFQFTTNGATPFVITQGNFDVEY